MTIFAANFGQSHIYSLICFYYPGSSLAWLATGLAMAIVATIVNIENSYM